MIQTDELEALTVSLLRCGENFLLIKRSQEKRFAPGRWTGIGGHVEMEEHNTLRESALREVQEESGFHPEEIERFIMRRAILVNRPDQPLRVLLYFTGEVSRMDTGLCEEGELHWVREGDFERLDIVETTRPILSLLARDMQEDPEGLRRLEIGLSVFDAGGKFVRLVWG